MMKAAHALADIEERLGAREPMTRADAERMLACPDLVSVGATGERARQLVSGRRITFVRVLEVADELPADAGSPGELRMMAMPGTIDEAARRVSAVAAGAGGRAVTGFTLAELVALAGGELDRVSAFAAVLRGAGLSALAAAALDAAPTDAALVAQVHAVRAGGLDVWRAIVERAVGPDARLGTIERAVALQEATGALREFAPLPCEDPSETPSTGYDDVRTIAAARVRCTGISCIQVDWRRYGPKLAQVAIAFGANDIDGVSPFDSQDLGPRRSPVEDIIRQIRAAGGDPVERDAAGFRD